MQHKVVSRDEWIAARKAHLANEKAFTKARDQLSAERRALPWVKVEKNYLFDTPEGKKSLADLFDGRSQLIVYHFMLGPDWGEGCPSCSYLADHFDGAALHLAHRDVTLLAVSRAPLPEIAAYKKRMGWRFAWVSSYGNDFNYDFHVSFRPEQEEGEVYYNYEMCDFESDEMPGVVCSSKTLPGPSSTPTRPMRAVSTSWSALTTSSTSCPKAATKRSCHGAWLGCGAMTIMTTSGLPSPVAARNRQAPKGLDLPG